MKKLADISDLPLKWSKPAMFRREYELRAGGELAGRLNFRSAGGSMATGECADGSWTFKRVGFWQTRVSVRAAGSDVDVASFENNTWKGGGRLVFPDGRKFLATTGTWSTRFEFLNEADELLICIKPGSWLQHAADVEITPAGRAVPEMPLLLLCGWYLTLMTQGDSAAAMAVTTAVIVSSSI